MTGGEDRTAGSSSGGGPAAPTIPASESSWEDLYDNAPRGQLSMTPDGTWSDQILLEVAHRLRGTTRLSETVARFGGDEFVVLGESADMSAAQTLAHRIRAAVRRPLEQPSGFGLTASVGVAVHLASDGTVDPEQLVRAADDAMYRSKSLGCDRETVVQL